MKTPSHRSMGAPHARARGFTLLEVMVSLMITSIGLLGIAKIHALAYSSTATAGIRSLVALQAAGLAASMHADRSYWSAIPTPTTITITGTTISDGTLNATAATPGYCVSGIGAAPCAIAVMAAYDLHTYAVALNASLVNLNPITTINCPNPVGITVISCTIQVTWNEKAVSVNKEGAANTVVNSPTATFAPTYTLYVEP